MSQPVKVSVYRGPKLIAQVDQPLRSCAGVPSVKFRRKNWPLLPGNRIEIDKPPLNSNMSAGNRSGSNPMHQAIGQEKLDPPRERAFGPDAEESII